MNNIHQDKNLRIATAAAVVAALAFGAVRAAPPPLPEDLSDFRHIHSFVIDDKDNPLFGFHHFYINDTGMEAFHEGTTPYPEGTVFLGAVYQVERDGGQVNEGAGAGFTLMRKDPDASATGGWAFAQYTPDGQLVEQDEAQACFQCHTQVKDQDYVFSRPLGMELPHP